MNTIVFPEEIPRLEIERLVLRPLQSSDAEALFAYFSDPEVTKFHDLPTFEDVEMATRLIDRFHELFTLRRSLRWGITKKEEDRVIGTCGFHSFNENKADVGFELSRAEWRKGIAREAVGVIISFGFEHIGLDRIEGWVLPANGASVRLLTRLGFQEIARDQGEDKERVFSLRKIDWMERSVPNG